MIYIFVLIGYLLGAIPFGLILTKLAGYGDIRKTGSGNIGATNVLRTGNKKLALAVLILDGGKGAAAAGLAFAYAGPDATILAGLAGLGAVIGHMFPLWLGFKGGKGVATTLGMLLALVPWTGLIALATWLAMAFTFRYSSLAALISILITPFATYFIYGDMMVATICAVILTLIWFKHRSNIQRLIRNEEPKIGKKK